MNVKEAHIVTGMSRDSAVSRQNPNLVYDAHNIRITTKDGNNSLLSVTNERGTKKLNLVGTITGTPIGSAVLAEYLVIFTHSTNETSNPDHIYRCTIENSTATINIIYEGDAGFDLQHPIETLPIYETDDVQKVYWVDGKNQPRVINILDGCAKSTVSPYPYITDALNFSREITLVHSMEVVKTASGGEFPTGTIQYAFSYYTTHGQETRLIDTSPMFYLSPKTGGLDATSIDHSSFHIIVKGIDTTFDYVRLYAIIRTSENAIPQCRVVGDYSITSSELHMYDTGTEGFTIDANSLYFIGGEELIAGTIAQKDNTLFLGNIELTRPLLNTMSKTGITVSALDTVYYSNLNNSKDRPTKSNEIYDYNPDNNRSSYFIKRFKYLETYRLGFIAQYKNGQWSEPFALSDEQNKVKPLATMNNYCTGGFKATFDSTAIEALKALGYRRVAPVVVYPSANGRRMIAQGIISPTVSMRSDKRSNSPYAQSSWFFRLVGEGWTNEKAVGDNIDIYGEIQCLDSACVTGNISYSDKYDNFFFVNTEILTMNSPDIECTATGEEVDFTDAICNIVGRAELNGTNYRVVDHFLETEGVGINSTRSQIIKIPRTSANDISRTQRSFTLYSDGPVDNLNGDEVVSANSEYLIGWTIYPWHRQGSLNNQAALTTKQRSNNFNVRTAMLKRNITANSMFANSSYFDSFRELDMNGYIPKIFNSDQLSGLNLSGGGNAYMYYGNIDKVIAPANGKYYIRGNWCKLTSYFDSAENSTIEQLSQEIPLSKLWLNQFKDGDNIISGLDNNIASDPVSMKYKSSPHVVLYNHNSSITFNSNDFRGLYIAELIRDTDDTEANIKRKFGGSITDEINNKWIRCGESAALSGDSVTINYLQGDCYFQRYDCLKTYPFTNEDQNSVIELFSTTLETYVNLDFRYDRNRGGANNVAISPLNFNLYNHPAYEQSGNYFTYHRLNYNIVGTRKFNNIVTWSKEKHFGEDIDTWASIDANNTVELDGSMGELKKIINYNNDLYTFQDRGFAKLLFNSRVQIPTSDNVPIEITNGTKMQGKMYIATQIGCSNKWSIVETPLGLYFNDDILRATYLFNGQLSDLSTAKGMKSWMNRVCTQDVWDLDSFSNCKAFYDKLGRDVYWVYKDTALVYSEVLGQYMSFMDYGGVPLINNVGNTTVAALTVNNTEGASTGKVRITGETHSGNLVFTASNITKPISLTVRVTEPVDQETYPAAEYTTTDRTSYIEMKVTIYAANTSAQEEQHEKYTISQIVSTLNNLLSAYFTITTEGGFTSNELLLTPESSLLDYTVGPLSFSPNVDQESPFWELGTGSYNMFFGQYKPYWLTFISNSNPTENKIYNNLAWRDIVTSNGTAKPFNTFDHIRVWNENQDTQSIRFSNSLSESQLRQPISYNAAMSNLRKKFNVWRCQIPRDKLATNSGRARISNPWTYIKLSREDIQTERHELMNLEVCFFM